MQSIYKILNSRDLQTKMLKNKHTNQNAFTLLSINLLKTNQWQLLPNTSHSNIFRNIKTHRLFELVHLPNWVSNSNKQLHLKHSLDHLNRTVRIDWNIDMNEIFMGVFCVCEQYYLCEKSAMNLCDKIARQNMKEVMSRLRQEQIVNTFVPILEALSKNLIPPSYILTSQSIKIDTTQTIRLSHPMFSPNPLSKCQNHSKQYSKLHFQCNSLGKTIMSCFIQPQQIHQLIEQNIQTICEALIQKGCSWVLIGIIVGLTRMSQGKWSIPQAIDEKVNDWEFWKNVVLEVCPQLYFGKLDMIMGNSPERPCDDQTQQDSQKTNFLRFPSSCPSLEELSKPHKYRSGKRIKVSFEKYENRKIDGELEFLLEDRQSKVDPNQFFDI